ncbi:MAG: hypothetical protein IJU71_06205, partial [Selenomonadaceae bacterium]|nr:hypothetical protein [Selenomonadaceae bacterium]
MSEEKTGARLDARRLALTMFGSSTIEGRRGKKRRPPTKGAARPNHGLRLNGRRAAVKAGRPPSNGAARPCPWSVAQRSKGDGEGGASAFEWGGAPLPWSVAQRSKGAEEKTGARLLARRLALPFSCRQKFLWAENYFEQKKSGRRSKGDGEDGAPAYSRGGAPFPLVFAQNF